MESTESKLAISGSQERLQVTGLSCIQLSYWFSVSLEKALCNLPSDIFQLILDKEEQTNKVLFKMEYLGYFITFYLGKC